MPRIFPSTTGGGGSGGGAPTDATYVTLTANATLSAETLFGSLLDNGTLVARPTGGTKGRYWLVTSGTSLGNLYYDDGTVNWVEVMILPWSVANGGTGAASFTDAGVLIGNGTGAIQVTSAGTAGQVLTSNGAGVDPTFQAAASGGHTIQDDNTSFTARTNLSFQNGFIVVDDGPNNQTEVNLDYAGTAQIADIVVGGAESAGSSITAARGDHVHAITGAQPLDAELTALASTTSAADALPYFTGAGTATTTTLTAFARTLLDDTTAAAARATLGLVIGTDVQAFDAELTALASTTSAADALPYFTGAGTATTTTLTAFARTLLDDTTAAAARATLAAAPAAATYVTLTADGELSAETLFGSLLDNGTLVARPTGGTKGRYWLVTSGTSLGNLYYDDGTVNWVEVMILPWSVANGGTGAASFTDAGVLIGNGTGAIQVTTAGTAGQVLTSNGPGVDPTFQAAGAGSTSITIKLGDAAFDDGINTLDFDPAYVLAIDSTTETRIGIPYSQIVAMASGLALP